MPRFLVEVHDARMAKTAGCAPELDSPFSDHVVNPGSLPVARDWCSGRRQPPIIPHVSDGDIGVHHDWRIKNVRRRGSNRHPYSK